MNFINLGGMAMYPVPKLSPLAFQFSYAYTVTGRNVGQANAFTIGLLYTFNSRPESHSMIVARKYIQWILASAIAMYAGIHYRSDIEMGKEHGKRLAGYTVRFAQTDGADFANRTATAANAR